MRSFYLKTLLGLAAGLLPGLAQAQVGSIGSYSRPRVNPHPTFSPYLNLTRPGGAANNYFGIVRPQVDAMRNFQQIQQNLATSGSGQGTGEVGLIDPSGQSISYFAPNAVGMNTGHAATYFNYSHYYNFQGLRGFPSSGNASAGLVNRGNLGIGQPVFSGGLGRGTVGTPIGSGPSILVIPQNSGGSGSSNNQ